MHHIFLVVETVTDRHTVQDHNQRNGSAQHRLPLRDPGEASLHFRETMAQDPVPNRISGAQQPRTVRRKRAETSRRRRRLKFVPRQPIRDMLEVSEGEQMVSSCILLSLCRQC